MDEYANGLDKATDRMIRFCKAEIKKIKQGKTEPNTNRQITNGGKIIAYNRMVQKLLMNKQSIKQNRRD